MASGSVPSTASLSDAPEGAQREGAQPVDGVERAAGVFGHRWALFRISGQIGEGGEASEQRRVAGDGDLWGRGRDALPEEEQEVRGRG